MSQCPLGEAVSWHGVCMGPPWGQSGVASTQPRSLRSFLYFFWIRAIEMADNRLSDRIYGQKGVPNSDQGVVSQSEIFFS